MQMEAAAYGIIAAVTKAKRMWNLPLELLRVIRIQSL